MAICIRSLSFSYKDLGVFAVGVPEAALHHNATDTEPRSGNLAVLVAAVARRDTAQLLARQLILFQTPTLAN